MSSMMNADLCSIVRTHPDRMTWQEALAQGLLGTTVVTYRLWEGDEQQVEEEDLETGKTVRVQRYVRDKLVRTVEDKFSSILTDDQVRARLMAVLSDYRDKTIIPEQRIGHELAESTVTAPTPLAAREAAL